jgi:hypothetical protein
MSYHRDFLDYKPVYLVMVMVRLSVYLMHISNMSISSQRLDGRLYYHETRWHRMTRIPKLLSQSCYGSHCLLSFGK